MAGYPGTASTQLIIRPSFIVHIYHYLRRLSDCKLLPDLRGVTLAQKGQKAERWMVSAPGGR